MRKQNLPLQTVKGEKGGILQTVQQAITATNPGLEDVGSGQIQWRAISPHKVTFLTQIRLSKNHLTKKLKIY